MRLALSLHAADEALRSELMPVNERYPLAEVIEACRAFYARRRRRVFIEYVMLAGVNDRYEQALALARLLAGSAPCGRRARAQGERCCAPGTDLQGQPDPLQPLRRRASRAPAASRSRPSATRWRRTACRPPCA